MKPILKSVIYTFPKCHACFEVEQGEENPGYCKWCEAEFDEDVADKEIKKALEKAINEYAAEDVGSAKYFKLIIAILDLFNRQQAEIERLEKQLNSKYKWENMLDKKIKDVKAEAVKEFAEEAKAITYHYYDSDIDELLKERLGEG